MRTGQGWGMENAQPSLVPPPVARRRHVVTLKLLFIALLVLLLHVPLGLINGLRQERSRNREEAHARQRTEVPALAREPARAYSPAVAAAEGYRMVERSLKHSVLVLTLVFAAFFLFETLAGLRLHAVHYGLVGAALVLFYLALLALGEVLPPGQAYVGAAVASSLLVVCRLDRGPARGRAQRALRRAAHGGLCPAGRDGVVVRRPRGGHVLHPARGLVRPGNGYEGGPGLSRVDGYFSGPLPAGGCAAPGAGCALKKHPVPGGFRPR